ncbi:hypothetical protein, partial [Actinomadura hibisca]|uniref:hypothetical protein n=1 Tax=Actinomadura hibisca TaxID=68565 RepID=UPI0035A22FD0
MESLLLLLLLIKNINPAPYTRPLTSARAPHMTSDPSSTPFTRPTTPAPRCARPTTPAPRPNHH